MQNMACHQLIHIAHFLDELPQHQDSNGNMSATFEHAWWRRTLSVSYTGFSCFSDGRAVHHVNAMKECLVI